MIRSAGKTFGIDLRLSYLTIPEVTTTNDQSRQQQRIHLQGSRRLGSSQRVKLEFSVAKCRAQR